MRLQRRNRILFAIAFAFVGGFGLLLVGRAASPYVAVESENGTIAGQATVKADNNASGGQAVSFGSVTSTGIVMVDPASPAITAITNNITSVKSATFSPPAASILYAAFSVDSPFIGESGQTYVSNPHVASVTNTGTPLTWVFKGNENSSTSSVGGFVEVWWAYNPTTQNGISVTGNFAQATKNVTPPVGALQVLVIDNAAPDQSAAAWQAAVNTGNTTKVALASIATPANALVLGVFDAWNSVDNPPGVPVGQKVLGLVTNSQDVDSYWIQGLSAPTTSSSSVTLSATLATSDNWHVVAWVVTPN